MCHPLIGPNRISLFGSNKGSVSLNSLICGSQIQGVSLSLSLSLSIYLSIYLCVGALHSARAFLGEHASPSYYDLFSVCEKTRLNHHGPHDQN